MEVERGSVIKGGDEGFLESKVVMEVVGWFLSGDKEDTAMALTAYADADHAGCPDNQRKVVNTLIDYKVNDIALSIRHPTYHEAPPDRDTAMALTAYADADHAGCPDNQRSTP
nr:hypothetical protein [Tanacetum cinerariifolium]